MVIKVMDFIVLESILYPILDHTPSLSPWVSGFFVRPWEKRQPWIVKPFQFPITCTVLLLFKWKHINQVPSRQQSISSRCYVWISNHNEIGFKEQTFENQFFCFVLFIISQSVGLLSTPWQRSSHPISIESQFNPIPWILCIGTESTTFTILIQQ